MIKSKTELKPRSTLMLIFAMMFAKWTRANDPNCFQNQRFPKVIQSTVDEKATFAEAITAHGDTIYVGGYLTQQPQFFPT